MKYKNFLIGFLVVLALIGYIACSVFMFDQAYDILDKNGNLPENYLGKIKSSIMYLSSGLTGLVGGIVATAFGVKAPIATENTKSPLKNSKFQSLGRMVDMSFPTSQENNTTIKNDNESNTMGLLGFLYALAYILVGVAALVIWWNLDENTIQPVSNMATTFFGMMIPIVAQYVNNQNK